MPNLAVDKVEAYVFRRAARGAEFLALRRAPGRNLPGVWQPVTGKIELLETPAEAALREVREETGLLPIRFWRLEQTSIFLDARGRDIIALPLFAAEVPAGSAVELSKEHDASQFTSAAKAARLYLWDSQRMGLAAVTRQILPGGPLAAALELPIRGRGRSRRPSSRGRKPASAPGSRR